MGEIDPGYFARTRV